MQATGCSGCSSQLNELHECLVKQVKARTAQSELVYLI